MDRYPQITDDWKRSAVQASAERIVDQALRSDGSLFSPGDPIWTLGNVEHLNNHFPLPDKSAMEFTRFEWLIDEPAEVIQLAAEIYFIHFLLQKHRAAVKRSPIHLVLNCARDRTINIPIELNNALEYEYTTGAFTPNHHAQRVPQLRFISTFAVVWKRLGGIEQAKLLATPSEFNNFMRTDALLLQARAHEKLNNRHHVDQQRRALSHIVTVLGRGT